MSFLKEFKEFTMRGNVVDLAIGVVIGSAFGAIVNSLVGDIIMPVIGALTGGVDFTGLNIKVGNATLAYGKFIQAIFIFIIVAFTLFSVIKMLNRAKRKTAPETPALPPTKQEQLLMEIRDLLKK